MVYVLFAGSNLILSPEMSRSFLDHYSPSKGHVSIVDMGKIALPKMYATRKLVVQRSIAASTIQQMGRLPTVEKNRLGVVKEWYHCSLYY